MGAVTAIRQTAASAQRHWIAHELHDMFGHHVSLISVQAGVALYLMDDDPDQARVALTAIRGATQELLREMRSMLGVLHGADDTSAPVAGLARLDALVADNRAAGLPVSVQIRGAARDLPPGVDLAAFRIVQEALTNTRRHAGPARASVLLQYDDRRLVVQVDDDGVGPSDDGAAHRPGRHGLAGVRERALALGGIATTGPRAGGGFRVCAHLPLAPRTGPDRPGAPAATGVQQ